jgi:hypothetical protein
MTLLRVVGAIGRLTLLIVLVASGAYVLVYLWRWEWQRAQIAGIFFLASLFILATLLVLRRLAAIEQHLAAAAPGTTRVPTGASNDPVRPARPFEWLPDEQSTYIFLPVLLGFGVALSLIATAAERVVAFAVGGATRSHATRPTSAPRERALALLLVLLLGAALALTLVARQELMTRTESTTPGTLTYLLEVEGRRTDIPTTTSVDFLATYCRDHAGVPTLSVEAIHGVDAKHAELVVSPQLGRFGAARFQGCLRDAVLDRRSVSIESVTSAP